ncbi:hypothetical protein JCM5350_006493 [Sporobolomyces pararoseus]
MSMSNNAAQENAAETATTTKSPTSTTRLALPAPPTASGVDDTTKIDVNGASVSLFDKMGPTIVNSDGTLSRIVGWPEMTPDERKRTLRVLGKRNQIRLEAKKEELGIKDRGNSEREEANQ